MENLEKKTLNGLFWSALELILNSVILLIINIILARLISARDYGLVGLLSIFITISNVFIESGLTQGLIRDNSVNNNDYSTIFVFNMLISIIFYILLVIFSGSISEFFYEPELKNIILFACLILISNSIGIVPRAILEKKIKFKIQTIITFISNLVSGIIAILLAFNNYGVWALVAYNLISSIIRSISLLIASGWRISFKFFKDSFKKHFSFGSNLLISSLIDVFYQNLSIILIGIYFTTEELGYFSNSNNIIFLLINIITVSIQRVTFPVLSKIQDDEIFLSISFRKLLRLSMMISIPFFIALVALAEPLFIIFLGERWIPGIKYFQLLCFVALFYPLHVINLNLIKVMGRSDLFLKFEIIKKAIYTILLFILFNLGIIGLILAQILISIIGYVINSLFSKKYANYSSLEQLKDITVFLIISLIMLAFMILAKIILAYLGIATVSILSLIVMGGTGAIVFIFLLALFLKSDYQFLINLLKSFLK